MKKDYAKPKLESIGTLNELGKQINAASVTLDKCIHSDTFFDCPYEYV
jgi:hypothetical protein